MGREEGLISQNVIAMAKNGRKERVSVNFFPISLLNDTKDQHYRAMIITNFVCSGYVQHDIFPSAPPARLQLDKIV